MVRESDAARIARLEERSESLLREIHRIASEMERIVGPQVGEVIRLAADLAVLAEDFEEFRDELRARAGMSTTLKVAIISGAFVLAGSIVTALVQILSSG